MHETSSSLPLIKRIGAEAATAQSDPPDKMQYFLPIDTTKRSIVQEDIPEVFRPPFAILVSIYNQRVDNKGKLVNSEESIADKEEKVSTYSPLYLMFE